MDLSNNTSTYKNYNNSPFQLEIPSVSSLMGTAELRFVVRLKKNSTGFMAVDSCTIQDQFKREYTVVPNNIIFSTDKLKQAIAIDIPTGNIKFGLSKSSLTIRFLAQDGVKYEVSYAYDSKSSRYLLQHVMSDTMTDVDKKRFLRIFDSVNAKNSGTPVKSDSSRELTDNQQRYDSEAFNSPSLEEYKNALRRELYFLKNNGGRKYKITSGRFLSTVSDGYSYSFELEAELFLSDDAPITLTIGNDISTNGYVLLCEGFQIIIIVKRDLGPKVSSAYISVEPWKLLEAILTPLNQLTSQDRIAIKLLEEGPKLATKLGPDSIPKGQQLAKEHCVNNDITVIWGPPGTGKTHTMAEIAIDFMKKGKSVLIVSHSNVSVDGVIKKTSELLKKNGLNRYLSANQVIRYGYVRDVELAGDQDTVAFECALKKRTDLRQKTDILVQKKEQLGKSNSIYSPERVELERKMKEIRASVRSEEKAIASSARILATTISKVTVDKLFENRKFDVVMFDEVSMAYVSQVICAAIYATEHLICVGDFKQLAPIAQSEAKKTLSTDIFSFLKIHSIDGSFYAHPWLVMLNEQRRMHPDISAFTNHYVYARLLKDYPGMGKQREVIVNRKPFSAHAMNLVDLSGSYCAAWKNNDNSRFNILSALLSFAVALEAFKNNDENVGIITPYAAQTRLIRAMIQDYKVKTNMDIACATVHQFQGSERDVIVFDAVESYPSTRAGWLMSKNENNAVTRLINVAVTRSRGKFITVANASYWKNVFEGSRNIFYLLIRYLNDKCNKISGATQMKTFVSQLDFGKNIRYFSDINASLEAFKKDIASAKERIIISIPDGHLSPETESVIRKSLYSAISRGIRVLMKTNDYKELPEGWKDFGYASENAVFPVIAIDKEIVWYGLPTANGLFKDGSSSLRTVYQTVFRITGSHTVEMIYSLTDLEYRIINNNRSMLTEKNNNKATTDSLDDGKGSVGLGKFVEEYKKCSSCQKPMILARGRSGKSYLKCSSCTNMEYLTTDFVNWYISKEYVRCPIHKCGVHAGLGKYGIYVRCEDGHYLKPEEI